MMYHEGLEKEIEKKEGHFIWKSQKVSLGGGEVARGGSFFLNYFCFEAMPQKK